MEHYKIQLPFTGWQIKELQQGLNAAKALLNISWDKIAESIALYFDDLSSVERNTMPDDMQGITRVDFADAGAKTPRPGNNIAKFAAGKHKSMAPEIRLLATFFWLSCGEIKNIQFSRANFLGVDYSIDLPMQLEQFLFSGADTVPFISREKLIGDYELLNGQADTALTLSISRPISTYTFAIAFEKKSISRELCDSETVPPLVSLGWCIITPNDVLLCFFEDKELNSVEHLQAISYGENDYYAASNIKELILLKVHDILPLRGDTVKDIRQLSNSWAELNAANIQHFQRLEK